MPVRLPHQTSLICAAVSALITFGFGCKGSIETNGTQAASEPDNTEVEATDQKTEEQTPPPKITPPKQNPTPPTQGEQPKVTSNCSDPAEGQFQFGKGTLDEPYAVCTWTQLAAIRNSPSSSYKLLRSLSTDDDDYNQLASGVANEGNGWLPIGWSEEQENTILFLGHFDGGGNSIDGLTIKRPEQSGIGLFSTLGGGAEVYSLSLTNVQIEGLSKVGGLAGVAGDNGTVTSIHRIDISGSITSVEGAESFVGGLVGKVTNALLTENHTNAAVSGAGDFSGGMLGHGIDVIIEDSSSTGNVTSLRVAGGLAGKLESVGKTSAIKNSHASGNVTGSHHLGGLVAFFGGEIDHSHASGSVESYGTSNYAGPTGGLVGELMHGVVKNSSAAGNIVGKAPAGGLIGLISGHGAVEVLDCHARGNVTARTHSGGFIGWIMSDHNVDIVNGKSSGNVIGRFAMGGFIGTAANVPGTQTIRHVRQGVWDGQFVQVLQDYSGGFIGDLGGLIIEDSRAQGDVKVSGASNGNRNTGGFVGRSNLDTGVIRRSIAHGNVYGDTETQQTNVGGFVGAISLGLLEKNVALGAVSNLYSSLGGFAGSASGGTLRDNRAMGSVTGQQNSLGGFAGRILGTATIERNYSVGAVTGTSAAKGGFAGTYAGTPTLLNNYWNNVTSQLSVPWQNGSIGGIAGQIEAVATSDFQDPVIFSALSNESFEANWKHAAGTYPVLSWE